MLEVTVQPALSLRAISAKQSPTLPTADRNAEIASSQKTLLAMTPERLLLELCRRSSGTTPYRISSRLKKQGVVHGRMRPPRRMKIEDVGQIFQICPTFSKECSWAHAPATTDENRGRRANFSNLPHIFEGVVHGRVCPPRRMKMTRRCGRMGLPRVCREVGVSLVSQAREGV